MSKKDKEKQKQPNIKQTLPESTYNILGTAEQVTVELPNNLNIPSVDQGLLKHYLKAKIMQRKRLHMRQPMQIVIFGKQESIQIKKVKTLNGQSLFNARLEQQNEKSIKTSQQASYFSIGNKLDIVIVYKNNKKEQKKNIEANSSHYYNFNNEQYNSFKRIVEQNFRLRDKLYKAKLGSIRGIILSGPTGTGKTTFIKRLKFDLEKQEILENQMVNFHIISATQLLSRVVGGAQQYVRKTFKSLLQYRFSVFVIQDMHLLFGQKQLSSHETTLAALFSQMDSYKQSLIVIGTYNSERDLSSVVFQSGRFQKQITLNLPNHHQRLQIIRVMVRDLQLPNTLTEDQLKQFNLRLNGFSIGEIKQIIRDAYIMKRQNITKDFLFQILKQYRPSQIKELIVEVPEIYWSGIGGYEDVKKQIRKVTELPLKFPQKFQLLGIQPSKGVLLYGPPGCSKTMMAKAIATQSKLNFIGIKGPQLYSKYVGQSERAIRNVFRKARAFSPCIIFFDQIDALATQRNDQNDVTNRLLGQLLTQMDGVQGLKEVVIIAATNRPQILDEALTRPGRFDHLIYVGPPNLEARKEIFKICLKKSPLAQQLASISNFLAQKTQNYTGAEINLLCREAALIALEENIQNPQIQMSNFQSALKKVKSRLNYHSLARYENFRAKLNHQSQDISKRPENLFKSQAKEFMEGNPFKF